MSEATDASASSGTLPDAPIHAASGDPAVPDILAVADRVLSLERQRAAQNPENDEEALEWHEVIELKAFSERKVWIEEKTKFLEQLPPIEVFTGLDAVRQSAAEVPGLPTREQLKQWMVEHDKIEKETEVFDSGELRKLKKFTKAAAQRNLSPADTDLIEITLTTIYALDKLLHLLRDRSDSLELLNIRLTWEERRIAAWADVHKLLDDLQEFLANRARWSPSVYENLDEEETTPPAPGEHTLVRRNSVVSMASEASSASLAGFSRGARYKLAESLSREAALFSSRVSSLRHTKIALAGKALDKLIDESRKAVPDELLDEQDKLENEGITELEDLGKFVMQVVMQWKKADEFYVETLKDKSTAENLLEEIEVAKLNHPNSRQDASFLSRTNALNKRLLLRGNPSTSLTFPKPLHRHFPEQAVYTATIIQQLSEDMASALQDTRKAENCAKEYHAATEAVKQVDAVRKAAAGVSTRYLSLVERMENGIATANGDGTPPDLSSEACLDGARHSVFLSLFPSVLEELEQADKETSSLLVTARASLLHLDFPGIDAQYKADSAAAIDELEARRSAAARAKELVASRTASLTQVRKVWSTTDQLFQETEELRSEIVDAMSRQMWRQQIRHDAPPTPESPNATLPAVTLSPAEVVQRLTEVRARLAADVLSPLATLAPSLGPALRDYLIQASSALESVLSATGDTARFWEAVQQQAAMMGTVRDEVHSLQIRIEDLRVRFEKSAQDVFAGFLDEDAQTQTEETLSGELVSTRTAIRSFLEDLPRRVPFVSEAKLVGHHEHASPKRRSSMSSITTLDAILQAAQPNIPFDPAALDKGVRTDSNTYSMMLSGALKTLESKADYFQLAKTAHTLDIALASLVDALGVAEDPVGRIHASLTETEGRLSAERLAELSAELDETSQTHAASIERALSPVRDALQRLRSTSIKHDVGSRDAVVSARQKAVENADSHYSSWKKSVAGLKQQLTDAHKAELHRIAEEARLKEEQERLEAETLAVRAREEAAAAEAERLAALEQARLEREKAEAEEKERRERQEALERAEREEQERLRAEEEERCRAEEEERRRAEAEERRRAEEERRRLEEERHRAEEEEQRRAEEEAQRRAAEEEQRCRAEEEEQRRLAEEAEARRLAEEAERQRLEEEERARQEAQRVSLLDTVDEVSFGVIAEDDIFSVRDSPSKGAGLTPALNELSTRIFNFRKRLRSLGINDVARPTARSTAGLPEDDARNAMAKALNTLVDEVGQLPSSVPDNLNIDADLRSLRSELEASVDLMSRVDQLADFSLSLRACDDALSDLLEHIDSYPSPPFGPLSTSHVSDHALAPEEQLGARLAFTRDVLNRMKTLSRPIANDPRVLPEKERILQTWTELEAMALDRISGQKSRPASVVSSGRSSRSSVIKSSSHLARSDSPRTRGGLDIPRPRQSLDKKSSFSKLSASPGGKFLAPPSPLAGPRRAASGSSVTTVQSRSSSRMSISSTRSISGPMMASSSSSSNNLFGSTFSSRQRTNSTTSNGSPSFATPIRRAPALSTTSRPRAQTGSSRTSSPALSDAPFSQGRSSLNLPRPPSSLSTWSRAPRTSFSALPKSPPSSRSQPAKPARKPYVANPKNKLDIAVGDVMNQLPVDIKIELVPDTWKDQSGKYWIGDSDPKLCFCRILRSQTVMVRVGGGWSELSKFIKDHFADAFRLLPDSSPPRMGTREEKWITSASLAQAVEHLTPPRPPRTPEPKEGYIPSFAISTPNGTSPKSLHGSPSPGSPLHALQFIRRAERDTPSYRPETPTRSSRSTGVSSVLSSPSGRQPAWRP
ncbi:hypothetical protein TRAPUB_1812 [Trametes pubescens]|uniref:GAR domain-containing protein n=1 Tax=Trametes pubescens TaxID=154538 RepID=A0A1M2VIC9_TRAPU|nr:hypothetical protein TRAPUB_1812 [Trametes pubescens]